MVVPSFNSTTGAKGFGRFPTISRAGLVFIGAGDSLGGTGTTSSPYNIHNAYPNLVTNTNAVGGPAVLAGDERVQAALIFSLFDPSEGFWPENPGVVLKVTDC